MTGQVTGWMDDGSGGFKGCFTPPAQNASYIDGLKWKITISIHIPKIVMNIMSDTFLELGPTS